MTRVLDQEDEREEQKRFREEMRLTLSATRPPPGNIEGLCNLPGFLSPYFTGREAHFNLLCHHLVPSKSDAPSQKRAVIYGMPGAGKTQLALHFATRNKAHFDNIFWVSGATYEKLSNGFQEIAELLNLPEKSRPEQHARVAAVNRWLTEDVTRHWLLVIDNVDAEDYKAVLDFLPRGSNGSMLMTTRKSDAALHLCNGDAARAIELREMNAEESRDLFMNVLGRDEESEEKPEHDLAGAIVKDMGNLPLAIDQAATHARTMECSLEEYREMFHSDKPEALSWSTEYSSSSSSVMHTFDTALLSLEKKFPRIGQLINLFAFLDPEGIPLTLLKEGSVGLRDSEPELHAILSSKMKLETDLGRLKSVSLVRRIGEAKNIWIHDLLHAIARLRLANPLQKKWCAIAASVIWHAYETIPYHWTKAFTNWDKNDEYMPHILKDIQLAQECGLDDSKDLALVLERTTSYYVHRGRSDEASLSQAIVLGKRAVSVSEKAFGENDPAVMKSMSTLAYVYRTLQRSEESMAWNKRALALRTAILGTEHEDTLGSMFDLARDYRDQGSLDEAERLRRLVVEGRSKLFGIEHSETIWAQYNMAEVWFERYRLMTSDEEGNIERTKLIRNVENVLLNCIVGFEKAVGRKHGFTLLSLRKLAQVYMMTERYVEAKQLMEEAAEGYISFNGQDHVECEVCYYYLRKLYIITKLPEEVKRLEFRFNETSWFEEHQKTGEITQLIHNF